MIRFGRGRSQDEIGTSTLEFALVVPVVLLVMLTALDFTRALLAYTTISHGSREGVRYAVLHPALNRGDMEEELEKLVEARTRPLSKALTTEVRWRYRDRISGCSADPEGCPWPPPISRTPRDIVVWVRVDYPWDAASAIAATFFATPRPPLISSTSFMDMRR